MAIGTVERAELLATHGRAERGKTLGQRIWAARWCYLFMLPNLILAAMFTFYPTVMSWYFAFLDWSGFASDREWVGLANFRELINDSFFWDAYRRSFLFMVVAVPIQVVLAFIVALVLNDSSYKLGPFFRTVFFLPVVTSAAIIGIVMTFVFSPFNGPVNKALLTSGLIDQPIDFLGDPDTALWTVAGVWIWKWFGITMIYWLAALQVVPQDIYEAARIDGATRWRLHKDITLPMIAPFAVVIVLITIVGALNVFGLVQTMTGGGPYFASEVMEVYIYRNAFGESGIPRLGYASAAALFFGVTVLGLSLLQGWGLKKANDARSRMKAS
ncbi:MAG TPA: sugar ABC transporter permease [Thermomicrobiales bacterium]|jgi:multiple sugar transport system permease protein|nr:sugar ABC transporter permease [Thermomicrobiales bacterium]